MIILLSEQRRSAPGRRKGQFVSIKHYTPRKTTMTTADLPFDYLIGPTACVAAPDVVRSIRQEVKEQRALSLGDIRLATAMGLLSTDSLRTIGFNDGVFYALEESVSRAPASLSAPTEMVRLGTKSKQRTMHALALMVDFSDNPGVRPKADFQALLFDAQNPDSMASYYAQLSGGVLTVTGEVIGYIRAPRPYSHYTNGQSGTGENFPQNTPGLLKDVLDVYCQTDTLNRFDLNHDGYVDGVFLIHAGGGAEAEADPNLRPHKIWSHKWVLPTAFEHNGIKVFAYSTEPEDGHVGVFAHEFGHVLGLPDLYDSSYRSHGIGDWCLMAGGSWGGQGDHPVRMSCWCLAKLGWLKPQPVQHPMAIELRPLAEDPAACYQVWPNKKKGPEYFLVECRQKTGQDAALPGAGLAIWHIDETQSSNNNPLGYQVALVQADGKRDLEYNRNSGDAGDLFPGTKKVTAIDDNTVPSTRVNMGAASGISFRGIAYSARQGKATFTIEV